MVALYIAFLVLMAIVGVVCGVLAAFASYINGEWWK